MTTTDIQTTTNSNAVLHGITAKNDLLPHESASALEALQQSLLIEYNPQGITETHLVLELSRIMWRKQRLQQAEHAVFQQGLSKTIETDYRKRSAIAKAALLRDHSEELSMENAVGWDDRQLIEAIADLTEQIEILQNYQQEVKESANADYQRALEIIQPDLRAVWLDDYLGENPAPDDHWQATYDSLVEWLQEFTDLYQERLANLKTYPAIKAHAENTALLAVADNQPLQRYATQLDKRFEKTLAMLLKLQQLNEEGQQNYQQVEPAQQLS